MSRLAHRLRDLVAIETPVQTPVGTGANAGGFTRSYTVLKNEIPAEIKDLSPREMLRGVSVKTGITTTITLRYDPDISKDYFVRSIDEEGPCRRFRIRSIQANRREGEMALMCEEIEEVS